MNFIDHLHALNDSTENGILSIKMGSATILEISLSQFGSEFHPAVGIVIKTILHLVEHHIIHTTPPDDIKLELRRLESRIHIVGFTGSGHTASLMKNLRKANLCRYFVAFGSIAQQLPGFSMPTTSVTCLNHKITNDPVEEHTIINTFAHLVYEIVTMHGRLVIEFNTNITTVCLKQHLYAFLSILRLRYEDAR